MNLTEDNKPLISIGMPIYNDRLFLTKAIESIRAQSYTNFNLILSDDNSTDGSAEICKYYATLDSRITYIHHKTNIGISRNMKFLLEQATEEFFMWAGNDDLWNEDYITILKNKLETNPKAVVAFCPYAQIDENDNIIEGRNLIIENYQGNTAHERLLKLIKQKSDGFGYGLFRKEMIKDVNFPIWWWPNQKCAYNNIYPTLVYYLAKGDYEFFNETVLWYNRIKENKNVNHKIPFSNNFYKAYLAFTLRKFNLFCSSVFQLKRASNNFKLILQTTPYIFLYWFLLPVFYKCHRKYFNYKKIGPEIFI